MITLYHFSGAICAQRVRLALAEKELGWESRECVGASLRAPEYLRINPNGVVPTLVHGDKVLTESRIICEYVEEEFDGPALMPSNPHARHQTRLWTKQVDDSLHLNVFILTFASVARETYRAMPAETRELMLPGLRDPIKHDIAADLLQHGMESRWVAMAVERFRRLTAEMASRLAETPFLAGQRYSLADIDLTAYVSRLVDLGWAELWRDEPVIGAWWTRMVERPSFAKAIVDWRSAQDIAAYERAREHDRHKVEALLSG